MHDLRRWTHDVHRSVDDAPYGGGPGMVMKAPVWGEALDEICSAETLLVVPTPAGGCSLRPPPQRWSARGSTWCSPAVATRASTSGSSTTPRGRMRVEEVSIGDYVLPGGESAALVMIEAVVRLLPEVLGNPASHQDDSHSGPVGCWKGPATPGRRAGAASTCPTCCCPVTTPGLRPGDANRRRSAPGSAGPTCCGRTVKRRTARSARRGTSS